MKSGDAIKLKFQTEYYFLHGLRLKLYRFDTDPGILAAWWKGRQN